MVDGWGLAHSLLADCCDDVLGAASSDASSAAAAERDAWTLVAALAANPARDNCLGARARALQAGPAPRKCPIRGFWQLTVHVPQSGVLTSNTRTQLTGCSCCYPKTWFLAFLRRDADLPCYMQPHEHAVSGASVLPRTHLF